MSTKDGSPLWPFSQFEPVVVAVEWTHSGITPTGIKMSERMRLNSSA
jgi:hypothetical protein